MYRFYGVDTQGNCLCSTALTLVIEYSISQCLRRNFAFGCDNTVSSLTHIQCSISMAGQDLRLGPVTAQMGMEHRILGGNPELS